MTRTATVALLMTSLTVVPPVQATSPDVFRPVLGRWTGTLEYQDYGADRRVRIPVTLTVTGHGAQARWLFTYDDFGRTVQSDETHRYVGGTYTVRTNGQAALQVFRTGDFARLGVSGRAVLNGREQENGVTVDVRRTITVSGKTLVTLTETRPAGGRFQFRNRSSYTRP